MTVGQFTARLSGSSMQWGDNDCCLIAADWIKERTGYDPMRDLRGTYRGWKQAARVWRAMGGVEKAVSSRLDGVFTRVPISKARPGDVALVRTHHKACTCAILDLFGLWMPTTKGYKRHRGALPIVAIWRIE